jgi:hypothetical protein
MPTSASSSVVRPGACTSATSEPDQPDRARCPRTSATGWSPVPGSRCWSTRPPGRGETRPSQRCTWRRRGPSARARSRASRPATAACEKSSTAASTSSVAGSCPGEYTSATKGPTRQGNMFSTASSTPVAAASSLTRSRNRAACRRCHRNGGCTTTVPAPSSAASSAERRSLSPWSRPSAKCASGSTGACTDSTGRPQRAEEARSSRASLLARSAVTITSTPSKPVVLASRKASSTGSGKTQDVLVPTVITRPGYDRALGGGAEHA